MSDAVGERGGERANIGGRATQGYTVIVDIVGFSEAAIPAQVEWVRSLLGIIKEAVGELEAFNIFPTGDGAILCIYHEGPPSPSAAAQALDFAREVLRLNSDGPFDLRLSINYSGMETVLDLEPLFGMIDSSHIQVGNGINLAERIIHFAEPNEIVLTGEYFDQLRSVGLTSEGNYSFYPYRDVFVKHTRRLELFAYKPDASESEYIYSPRETDEQHFKKFAYFPPLRADTVERFRRLNLRYDLEQLCSYAYDTIAEVNLKRTFISWADAYTVLKNIPAEGESEILVLSRADLPYDFWSTDESQRYLDYLRTQARRLVFKQYRLFLYKSESLKPVIFPEVLTVLRELHAAGTLNKLDVAHARGNLLLKYLFGVTIFPSLGCAVAPIPTASSYDEYLETIRFGRAHDAFQRFQDADFATATFKALVIADDELVQELIRAFDELRACPLEPI